MTRSNGGDSDDVEEPAWHERTSTVVGASAAAIAVIGLLWLLISYVTGGPDDPGATSPYYPDPTVSGRSTTSATSASNTETVTSTSPPVTTDINPGDTTTTSPTSTTSGTDTSSSSTTPPTTRRSSDGASTTRQRPRLNETRTLYPRP